MKNSVGYSKGGMVFFGIDSSLSNTAIAGIYRTQLDHRMEKPFVLKWSPRLITTTASEPIEQRLDYIGKQLTGFIMQASGIGGLNPVATKIGMEGFSFGAKFQRETLGMVHGIIRTDIFRALELQVGLVSPRTVKFTACPSWPGWNKKNWEAAKRKGKFKGSMPPKGDVGAGLFKHYGINTDDEHIADACCVALSMAIAHEGKYA